MALYFDVNGTVKEVNGWAGEGGSGGGGSVEPDMMIVPVGEGTTIGIYADLMSAFAGAEPWGSQFALDLSKVSLETKLLIITHVASSDEYADTSYIQPFSGSQRCFNVTYLSFMEADTKQDPISHHEEFSVIFESPGVYSSGSIVTQRLSCGGSMAGCTSIINSSNSITSASMDEMQFIDDDEEAEINIYAVVLYNGVGSIKQIKTAIEEMNGK